MKRVFQVLGLLLLTCLPSRAQISHIQTNAGSCGSAASCTLILKLPSNPGDTVNFGVDWDGPATVLSVVDDHGNVFVPSPLGQQAWSSSASAEMFTVSNIKADTNPLQITVMMSAKTVSFFEIYGGEYGGLGSAPTVDGKSAGIGTTGKPDSGPLNTTSAGDLIWCYGVSASQFSIVGKGFVSRSSFHNNIIEDNLNAPVGANDCSATASAGAWIMQGLALKTGTPPADTTPPTVSITAPPNGATIAGMYPISVAATDNVAVKNVQIQIDGVNQGGPIIQGPYTLTIDTIPLGNGPHTITATATDTSGNAAAASSTVTVTNQVITLSAIVKYDDGTPFAGIIIVSKVSPVDGSLTNTASSGTDANGTVNLNMTVDPQSVYNAALADSSGAWLVCDKTQGVCPSVNALIPLLLTDVTKFGGGTITLTITKTGNLVKNIQVGTTFNF